MGNVSSIQKINFENMQTAIQNNTCIINTLNLDEQTCLIKNTLSCYKEEELINSLLKSSNKNYKIIIYGKNTNDPSILKKYDQLQKLGFKYIYIYLGGLFEWLCLQDIYGDENFPTTSKELDILKYKPSSCNI